MTVGLILVTASWMALVPRSAPCDDTSADPWIGQTAERVLETDQLVAFATETFGEPTECEGEVTSTFDGQAFGVLTLGFPSGITFTFDTMAPSVTVATLRAVDGFQDPDSVLAALRDYAADLGLSIMWGAGSARVEAGEESQQFWDPDLGLNASATVTRADGVLVAVRLSKAP